MIGPNEKSGFRTPERSALTRIIGRGGPCILRWWAVPPLVRSMPESELNLQTASLSQF